jgi:hypothetical protein
VNRPHTRQRKTSVDSTDKPLDALYWDAVRDHPSATEIHKSSSALIGSENRRSEDNKIQSEQKATLTDLFLRQRSYGRNKAELHRPHQFNMQLWLWRLLKPKSVPQKPRRYHCRATTKADNHDKERRAEPKVQNQRYCEHFRDEHKAEKSLKHYESALQAELNIASKKPQALRNDLLPLLLKARKYAREKTF